MTFAVRLLTIILLLSVSTEVSIAAENNKTLAPLYQLLLSKGVFKAPSNLSFSACYTTGFPPRLIADCWMLYWKDNTENESGFRIEKKCWVDGDPEPAEFELWKTTPPDTSQAKYLGDSWQSGDHDCPAEGPAVWKFRLQAFNENLTSAYAGPVTPYKCPPGLNPQSALNPLQLTPGYGTILLTWDDYTNDETQWRIHREEVDAGENVVSIMNRYIGPNLETFLDEYLKSSTKYYYSVTPIYESINMFCEGWPGQIGNATTLFTSDAPSGPSSLTVSPVDKSSTSLALTWTDNANNESGFFVYRSLDNSNFEKIQTLPANSSSFTDTSLTPCTTYYYRVAAYNTAGSSDDDVGDETTPPAAPAGLIATKGPGVFSVKLDWDDTNCADLYHVYYLDDNYTNPYQEIITGTLSESELVVTDVPPNTYIFFRVSAEDSAGNEGSLSCTVSPSTTAFGGATSAGDTCKAAVGWSSSPVPVNLWASWNNYTNMVRVGWDSTPLTWNTSGDATSYSPAYDVQISTDNSTWYDVPGTPIEHPNEPPDSAPLYIDVPVTLTDTVFYFKIQSRFFYDCGGGPEIDECSSNPAYIAGRTAPLNQTTNVLPAPGLVVSKYYLGGIMVGWSTIQGADGYLLYRSTSRDSGYSQIRDSSSTSFFDSTVTPYTDYWYKVRAYKGSTLGVMSEPEYGNATQF